MSFLTDVFHGNWDNLGHDLSSDPVGTGIAGGALLLGTAGLAAPFLLGGEAALGAGLFGAGEAGLFGGAEAAGAAGGFDLLGSLGIGGAAEAGGGLFAGGGAESLLGGAAADSIIGSDFAMLGSDAIASGAGANITGMEAAWGGANATGLALPGTEAAWGGANVTGLTGPQGLESVIGASDSVIGGGGADVLAGGAGADAAGSAGADIGMSSTKMPGVGEGFSLTDWLKSGISKTNPLSLGLGAAGLGYNILKGQEDLPSTKALKAKQDLLASQSAQMTAAGQQLQTYLTKGNLPPALQAQVTEQAKAAKARIIANHAAAGRPTDPRQNSALAQELNSADMQALQLAGEYEKNLFNAGQSLISSGISISGLDNNMLMTLAQIDQRKTENVGKSIANFAAALNGGGSRIQIGGSSRD